MFSWVLTLLKDEGGSLQEGSVIVMMFYLIMAASVGLILYCARLAVKYQHIERDMRCVYSGVVYDVMEIVYDRDDWFKRSVRLRQEEFPYYFNVLISEENTVRE